MDTEVMTMKEFFDSIIAFEKEINLFTVILRLVLAALFGGVIGLERGRHGSSAGLRTHILVCLGGALTALLGLYSTVILGYEGEPLRVAAQVVSGIGFLGAGMIIVKNENMIVGLTTAAIMWATAIIGISLGIGFYSGALVAVLICIFTAAFLTRLERKRKTATHIYMEVDDLQRLEQINDAVKRQLSPGSLVQMVAPKSGVSGHMGMVIVTSGLRSFDEFKQVVKQEPGVRFIIKE